MSRSKNDIDKKILEGILKMLEVAQQNIDMVHEQIRLLLSKKKK